MSDYYIIKKNKTLIEPYLVFRLLLNNSLQTTSELISETTAEM